VEDGWKKRGRKRKQVSTREEKGKSQRKEPPLTSSNTYLLAHITFPPSATSYPYPSLVLPRLWAGDNFLCFRWSRCCYTVVVTGKGGRGWRWWFKRSTFKLRNASHPSWTRSEWLVTRDAWRGYTGNQLKAIFGIQKSITKLTVFFLSWKTPKVLKISAIRDNLGELPFKFAHVWWKIIWIFPLSHLQSNCKRPERARLSSTIRS